MVRVRGILLAIVFVLVSLEAPMAENSLFWTDATGDGGPYNQATLALWLEYFNTPSNAATQGVLAGAGNELEVSGVASPVDIATGGGLVKGHFYWNTAVVNLAIPTPAGATRIDRVALEADWTTQTVRIVRVAGTEGTGLPPALTQTDGTLWQISLAQASITTGGAITITDERAFCHFATRVSADMIDAAVAGNGLAGGEGTVLSVNVDDSTIEINADTLRVKALGITSNELDTDAVTVTKIATDAVVAAKIAANAVTSSEILNEAVTAAKIAAAVAGAGLSGGAGAALSVNVDDATIEIDTDTLQLKNYGVQIAHHATRTRTYFVPAHYGWNDTDNIAIRAGRYGVPLAPDKASTIAVRSQVPADYVSDLAGSIVFMVTSTGNVSVQRRFFRGRWGNPFDMSDSGVISTVFDAVVAWTYYTEVTNSGGTPVAGDFILCYFTRNGLDVLDVNTGELYVIGLELSYTADS